MPSISNVADFSTRPSPDHVDVLIMGAGISGIGAGYHIKTRLPGKTFAILEAREAIGGTWDLFRYPGIRSDSDLHTFGYEFKPWTSENAIAPADEILSYLRETVDENALGPHIRFGHRILSADWSSTDRLWTVHGERASYRFGRDELYVRARVTSTKHHPNPSELGDFERAWVQPARGPAAPKP